MASPDERRCNPTSLPELERRRAAVRRQMPAAGIDALIIQGVNNATGTGGAYRWFTGISVFSSYPQTVIVPREGLMTLVMHGGFNEEKTFDGSNPDFPGSACAWARRPSRGSTTAAPTRPSWWRAK